jgi:hypothetical protein
MIKITQAPGKSGVTLTNTIRGIRHFKVWPGDATITATDESGDVATVVCPVPPKKK